MKLMICLQAEKLRTVEHLRYIPIVLLAPVSLDEFTCPQG